MPAAATPAISVAEMGIFARPIQLLTRLHLGAIAACMGFAFVSIDSPAEEGSLDWDVSLLSSPWADPHLATYLEIRPIASVLLSGWIDPCIAKDYVYMDHSCRSNDRRACKLRDASESVAILVFLYSGCADGSPSCTLNPAAGPVSRCGDDTQAVKGVLGKCNAVLVARGKQHGLLTSAHCVQNPQGGMLVPSSPPIAVFGMKALEDSIDFESFGIVNWKDIVILEAQEEGDLAFAPLGPRLGRPEFVPERARPIHPAPCTAIRNGAPIYPVGYTRAATSLTFDYSTERPRSIVDDAPGPWINVDVGVGEGSSGMPLLDGEANLVAIVSTASAAKYNAGKAPAGTGITRAGIVCEAVGR